MMKRKTIRDGRTNRDGGINAVRFAAIAFCVALAIAKLKQEATYDLPAREKSF